MIKEINDIKDINLKIWTIENIINLVDNYNLSDKQINELCEILKKTSKKDFFKNINEKGVNKLLSYLSKLLNKTQTNKENINKNFAKLVINKNKELNKKSIKIEKQNKKEKKLRKGIISLIASLLGIGIFGTRKIRKGKKKLENKIQIIEKSPNAIFTCDINGKNIIGMNEKGQKILQGKETIFGPTTQNLKILKGSKKIPEGKTYSLQDILYGLKDNETIEYEYKLNEKIYIVSVTRIGERYLFINTDNIQN